jgi:hypothetical protein
MRPRVSIRRLLAVVAFFAVGFAALANPTDLWASCLFSLALATFGLTCLGAAFARGPRRAGFAGMASVGGGYLMLAFGPWFCAEIRPHLLTTWVIDNLPPPSLGILKCPDDDTVLSGAGNLSYSVSGFQRWNSVAPATAIASLIGARERIGHSLFTFVFAFMGGLAARFLAASCEAELAASSVSRGWHHLHGRSGQPDDGNDLA